MTSEITADAWAFYDMDDQHIIRSSNLNKRRQIASITKIFTMAAALRIERRLKINPNTLVLIVDTFETGTTANLQKGVWISIEDLYYGMMLPSGNDAALTIAMYFGFFLSLESKGESFQLRKLQYLDLSGRSQHTKLFHSYFLAEMAGLVKQLQLADTVFDNPHGLNSKYSWSTAKDIITATMSFIKDDKFRRIVTTRTYQCRLYPTNIIDQDNYKALRWQNTNILLKQGYEGVKTGFTNQAGGCLVSIKLVKFKYTHKKYMIVVLGSKDQSTRFSDTEQLVANHIKYLEMMSV